MEEKIEIKKANQPEMNRTNLNAINDSLQKQVEILERRLKEKEIEIDHHVKKMAILRTNSKKSNHL